MSRCRSCLFKSEQSASSLSQSEGIQSTPAVEYQAGCCRGSSCSTDTVDSSALFMGMAGAYEMASRWGLDFYSPQLYWGRRDAWHLQRLLIVSKNDNTRNSQRAGDLKGWPQVGTRKIRQIKYLWVFNRGLTQLFKKHFYESVVGNKKKKKKENKCSRAKIVPLWKIKYILWLSCQFLWFTIKSINTDHKVNMKTRSI